jgi:hypothetical protein
VNRLLAVVAVLAALLVAVHVGAPGLPAPLPVFLGFAVVIGVQLHMIAVAAGVRVVWRARPW